MSVGAGWAVGRIILIWVDSTDNKSSSIELKFTTNSVECCYPYILKQLFELIDLQAL